MYAAKRSGAHLYLRAEGAELGGCQELSCLGELVNSRFRERPCLKNNVGEEDICG